MKIPNKDLDEFIRIYKEEFGEELDRSQAEEIAGDFLRLYEVLASRRPPETTDGRASEDVSKKT